MDTRKRRRLADQGWRVGSTSEFLGLSEAEDALVEMRLALSSLLRSLRVQGGMTQAVLAKRLQSSQSRIAKMEAGDATVSLELLIRAVLVLGGSRRDIASALAERVA